MFLLNNKISNMDISHIGNLYFSPREIDVLSCIISARTARKTIADILMIEPTTVATYITSIMKKINCSAIGCVCDFIEKSGQTDILREHFNYLFFQKEYKKFTKSCLNILKKQKLDVVFIKYDKDQLFSLVKKIELCLQDLDFVVSIEKNNIFESHNHRHIYINYKNLIQKINVEDEEYSCFELLMLKIIDFITSNKDVKFLIDNCKEKINKKNPINIESIETHILSESHEKRENNNKFFIFLKIIFVFFVLLFFYYSFFEVSLNVRSELVLPPQSHLLERKNLIKLIKNHLYTKNSDISCINLVGIGGVGKTTVARMIGRQHKGIVFEVNAETSNSIKESFKNFGYAFLINEKEKENWHFICSIENCQEKDQQILEFVRNKLYLNPDWLIIFDNLECSNDVLKYFPKDSKVWGRGQIIVTSRNSNLNLGTEIKIPDLTEEESLDLFNKEINNRNKINDEESKKIYSFLKNIPPFPLDVAIAGKYIKDTKISYKEYLKNINSPDFEKDQKNTLFDSTYYDKTRYEIINLSLNNIIESDSAYIPLILFVSIIESQNIPKKLLEFISTSTISNQFIRELKKYSLIIDEEKFLNITTISFHRCVQDMMYSFIKKNFSEEKILKFINEIISKILNFEKYNSETGEYDLLYITISHVDKLLQTSWLDSLIKLKLQMIHCSICSRLNLGEFIFKFEKISDHNLDIIKKSPDKFNAARFLMHYGEILLWKGFPKKSKKILEESLYLFQCLNIDCLEVFHLKVILGSTYRVLGNYEKALKITNECQLLFDKFPNHFIEHSRFLAHKGLIYRDTGNYKQALLLLQKSIDLLKKNKQAYLKNQSQYEWITSIYSDIGYSFKNFKKINIKEKNFPHKMYSPKILFDVQQYDEAFSLILEAKEIADKNNYQGNYNYFKYILPTLGKLYIHYKQYSKAKEELEKCLKLLENHYGKNHFQTAKVLCYLGEIDIKENNLELAEQKMMKAYTLLKEFDHSDIYIPLEYLTEIYQIKCLHEKNKDICHQYSQQILNFLEEAYSIISKRFPIDSEHIERISKKIKFYKMKC